MKICKLAFSFVIATYSVWPVGVDAMVWQADTIRTIDSSTATEVARAIERGQGIRIRSGDAWIRLSNAQLEGNGVSFGYGDFVPFSPATEIQVQKQETGSIVGGVLLGGVLGGGLSYLLSTGMTGSCDDLGDLFCGLDEADVRSNALKGAVVGALLGAVLGARKHWVTLRF